MPTPILATKLYIPPPRPKFVLRPRLIERLNEGLQRKLTLISAPAGFGKTTLISEWVAGCGRPVAWLSLDEGDSDPARFLAYFIAALQTIAPTTGVGVLAALQSPQPPPTELLLTTLLNEIAVIPDNFILVLDDYHIVDAKPVDNALTFLLEHLPPQMHLVIATREDPSLPLARLRARSQLTELRAGDLRFTPAEAAEFLNQMMGLNLSAENIAALEARTEGWIAGLQLAALSMQGRSDAAGFIKSFTGSHHFILDYLVEEVLQRQPEHVRNFLLQTSILDRLSSPLCDAVTRQEDGRGMLEALERGNLFVIPLDDQRQWYRYHALFAEVLQARLIDEQPDQIFSLHQRASEWYEQNSLLPEAIRHALAAKDFKRAAGLSELAWPVMEQSGESKLWLGWVRTLPNELVRARPVLGVDYAYALLGRGELDACVARLQDAERWLDMAETPSNQRNIDDKMVVADEEQFRLLPASIAIARAYCALAVGDVPGTVTYAKQVLDLLPEEEHHKRGQATALLGLTYWSNGDLEAASRTFADYTMKLRAAGNLTDVISTTFVLAEIRMALGRLREAVSLLEQLLQFLVNQDKPMPADAADLYRALGELDRERGDLATATEHLLRSKELGEHTGQFDWQRRLCVAQARMQQTQGDLDGALELFCEAERLYIRTPLPDVRPIAAFKARVWAMQGRLAEALGWARDRGLSVDDDLSYLREFEHITLARVLIARYKNDPVDGSIHEAIGLLERLRQAVEEGRRMGSVIEILALLALAHAAQGDLPLALVSLECALTLAEPEGYVRLFVDEGVPMARLLQEAVSRGIAPGYTRRLLAALSPEPEQPGPSIPPSVLVEPLSERELEVLQHIAEGFTNQEIADRLYLSLYTVKAHARNIYGKLDVNNRTQAVARARELGVLPQF